MKFHKGEIVRGIGEVDFLYIEGRLGVILGHLKKTAEPLYLVEFYEGQGGMHSGLGRTDADGHPLEGKGGHCWYVDEYALEKHIKYTPEMAEEML